MHSNQLMFVVCLQLCTVHIFAIYIGEGHGAERGYVVKDIGCGVSEPP